MKIYVASSWRNSYQPHVVKWLREVGHDVYDFKNPRPGDNGFSWSDVDPDWEAWKAETYRECLFHPVAQSGFHSDFDAMKWADACVLVLPCGRSAHLELGWMAGAGKRTIILTRDGEEPELMALLADKVAISMVEVIEFLKGADPLSPSRHIPQPAATASTSETSIGPVTLSSLELDVLRACSGQVVRNLPYNDEQIEASQRLRELGLIYSTMEDDQPTSYTTDLGDAFLKTHSGGAQPATSTASDEAGR